MASETEMQQRIRKDLELTAGHREGVKAGFFEKRSVKKVSPNLLHVNPMDEFSIPKVGPNYSIIENYSAIARRNHAMGDPVFDEPILVFKLRENGYMILNGHHRWAGAIKARVPKVRIQIDDPVSLS